MNRSDPLEAACLRAVEGYGMLCGGGGLVVGVSGGADSVALLHFLHRLAPERGLRLSAAHLNHRLRGAESDRDEAFVRALCGRLEVPLTVASADVAAAARERGQSVEECAREERYALFRRCAGGEGGRIATAHTLDDSAETVLLNLARGSALRGLCGIPPVRGDRESGAAVIRPLIGCTRRQVEEYCAAHGLEYVTDSSNFSERYARNRLRHRAMPALESVNPAFLRAVAGTMDALRADADFLDGLADKALEELAADSGGWDAAGLLALPEPIRRRAVLRLLAEHGVPAERRRVEQVESLLRGSGAARLSGAWYAGRDGRALRFRAADAPEPERLEPVRLEVPEAGGEEVFCLSSDQSLRVRCVGCKNFENFRNNSGKQFKNSLDCDKIDKTVILRTRMPGDQIRLAGRGCTKTLKKLYNEAGLSAPERGRRLVLADGNGPLWVEGFGPAERACAGPQTSRMLTLTVCGEEDFVE